MTETLQLGDGLELPLNVVTRRTAILGQTDTGKTSTAVVMVEEARKAGAQVVVIDPSGAWWGITSSADGEAPGVDMVVMGGEHGDVPLHPASGRAVARLVAQEGYSPVLDLDRPHFSSWGERIRFVADFLSELYELAHSQILVVIDESHRFAPQNIRDEGGDAARCLGAVVDAVALARRRGIGIIVITQRLAKLHKDVLELCEIIIAHRLRGNNDRTAIKGWLDEHGDDVKAALAEVGRLEKGVARVSAPTLGIDGVFRIRQKSTFDSSASINVGESAIAPKARAEVDLRALERLLADSIEKAKADDPKALRKRIQALEERLAGRDEDDHAAASTEVHVNSEMIGEVRAITDAAGHSGVPFLDDAVKMIVRERDSARHAVRVAHDWHRQLSEALHGFALDLAENFTPDDGAARSAPSDTEGVQSSAAPARPANEAPVSRENGRTALDDDRRRPRGAGSDPSYARAATANGSGVDLPRAAADLAETLAAFPDGLGRERLALLTGRKPRGGSWNTAMKALQEHAIAEDRGEVLVPTGRAREMFPDATPLAGQALVDVWRAKLGAAARDLFDVLVASAPDALTYDEIGERTGRAPRGGSWNTAVKQLKTSGLAVERTRGALSANPDLVPGAA